jgi:capsular exopolysaccharide synthesis family protein
VACLGEFLDDTIRTLDDVERFRPLPVLAHIPTMEGRSTGPTPRVALREGRDTPAAEAYRALRTAVQLLGVVRPLTVVQFTSSTAGEGKTTTVANLAAVLAGAGRRVVIVDCDMRRPQLHEVFDLPNEVGLTSVLVGEASVSDALQAADGFPGLSVLTSGARAPNPSELLSLKQTSEIIFALQARFDFVLLDSPPVLPVTDAVVLSEWVEAVIVVTAAGVTKRKALRRALQALAQTAAPVRGLVLNRAALEPAYSYAYTAPIPRQPAAPQG